ncbi:MAG: 1-(5-phosphoribosyl)-5-[(5-phosphoribosylamino)methylideneamino]imidazole-4-carboxamide isomerase [Dehalococcoidia bacterium]|nr:1-(5-phosphoribosyl)-5-[(5-phosphoribosylamino)methylideneamino]imidazole-4-carboxamide isomerase [Dehalococcoidia bacterium]
MEIIPAIDIRKGKCVRLYQGDYRRQIIYDEKPLAVALKWGSQGMRWLHIADLDGAAGGKPENIDLVEEIIKESGLSIQFGGGIRQESMVEELLRRGVRCIILSTSAVENPEMVRKVCSRFGEAIVVSLDARDGKICIHGWRKDTVVDVLQLGRDMVNIGVKRFIFTDIGRDGTLTGPNFDMIGRLVSRINVPVIVAGGISKLEHLERLKQIGVEGAIIGKALYTGDIDLREAITSLGHREAR